jgi:hypothetical protein
MSAQLINPRARPDVYGFADDLIVVGEAAEPQRQWKPPPY